MTSDKKLDVTSPKNHACLLRLSDYFNSTDPINLPSYAQSKLAAVLVLLYEKSGELYVLLTKRSKQLRTHAGQTALPGGKKDTTDKDIFTTAFREANEEVGLPVDSPFVTVLGCLDPFISAHRLLVFPVVAFLSQPNLLNELKASEVEVATIFSHPLFAILDPTYSKSENLVPIGSEEWPYEEELYSTSDSVVPMLGNTTYRMHRLRSSASPIKGLTADILIRIAEIAYDQPTTYERFAPDQLKSSKLMVEAASKYEPPAQ